jgi:hypothetical protein
MVMFSIILENALTSAMLLSAMFWQQHMVHLYHYSHYPSPCCYFPFCLDSCCSHPFAVKIIFDVALSYCVSQLLGSLAPRESLNCCSSSPEDCAFLGVSQVLFFSSSNDMVLQ